MVNQMTIAAQVQHTPTTLSPIIWNVLQLFNLQWKSTWREPI